jgi:hypothetical protein
MPKPRNGLERLWNKLGFHTPHQRKALNQYGDAQLHEARLRRLAENGGLDPHDEDDYMQIQIHRHKAIEQAKTRSQEIKRLARDILVLETQSMNKLQTHMPTDVQKAIEKATAIYDLTTQKTIPLLKSVR